MHKNMKPENDFIYDPQIFWNKKYFIILFLKKNISIRPSK